MGGSTAEKQPWTREAYLEMERASDVKHELHDGEIFAMSGARRAHNLITGNVGAELRAALRGRPCEAYLNEMRVSYPPQTRYLYPDAAVVCGPPRFEDETLDTLLNPVVVFEVLSKSTERFDRGKKFEHYRAIPSLREYVLLAQTEANVEQFTRQDDGTWLMRALRAGEMLRLTSIDVSLAVDALYERVFDYPPAQGE